MVNSPYDPHTFFAKSLGPAMPYRDRCKTGGRNLPGVNLREGLGRAAALASGSGWGFGSGGDGVPSTAAETAFLDND